MELKLIEVEQVTLIIGLVGMVLTYLTARFY
jgi:hypothetical protein